MSFLRFLLIKETAIDSWHTNRYKIQQIIQKESPMLLDLGDLFTDDNYLTTMFGNHIWFGLFHIMNCCSYYGSCSQLIFTIKNLWIFFSGVLATNWFFTDLFLWYWGKIFKYIIIILPWFIEFIFVGDQVLLPTI